MNPDRWRQIEHLYHATLERKPGDRAAFLHSACAGDELLRREVEDLLNQPASTAGLIDGSAWAGAADLETRTLLSPGAYLGHYHVLGLLGEGGMGRVYRGRDTRLDRPVAIKVSTEKFGQRFDREARAISVLNHPHICTLYDVGPNYIVTELVEGETLREWLKKEPPPERLIEVARQVLEALRAAHTAGLIHRDLKPANIMVRFDGYAKVLDFGLAKRIPSSPLIEADRRVSSELTAPGQIAGTAAYMSPEQVDGREIDQRSDLFSFGIVFYEMLAGKHPWPRQSAFEILYAILHDAPDPLPPAQVDPALAAIVWKLLEKDPADRYPSAEAVLDALGGKSLSTSSSRAAKTLKRSFPRKAASWTAGIAALALTAFWFWPRDSTLRAVDLSLITTDGGLHIDPSLSHDGKMLAYASDRVTGFLNIWLQQVGGGEPLQITRETVNHFQPSFSPDGTQITFRSEQEGGGVYLVPTLGGTPRRIANEGRRPRFSPDGQWVAYWVGDEGIYSRNKIYVVDLKGGPPRQLADKFFSAYYPVWSPDSRYVLFLGADSDRKSTDERFDWWVAPLDGSSPVATGILPQLASNGAVPNARQPGDWAGDSILFSGSNRLYSSETLAGQGRQLSIWRQRIAPNPWHAKGKPEAVTTGAGLETQPAIAAGKLALATTTNNLEIWMLPLNSQTGQAKGDLERVTSTNTSNQYPAVSRDGARLVFTSNPRGNPDLFVKDLRSGAVTGLTETGVFEVAPMPSPDGLRILYYVWKPDRATNTFSFWQIAAQGGAPREVCGDCDGPLYYWSNDEKKVIYYRQSGGLDALVVRDLESKRESVFARHSKYALRLPRLAPDEKWTVFQAVVSQTERRLFVAQVKDWRAGPEETWNYIPDARAPAAWSPSGNVLYFLSDRDGFRCIWAQRLAPSTRRPVGAAFAVQHLHTARRSLVFTYNLEIAAIGLSASADKLFFSMPEHTGNVWLARLEGRP